MEDFTANEIAALKKVAAAQIRQDEIDKLNAEANAQRSAIMEQVRAIDEKLRSEISNL